MKTPSRAALSIECRTSVIHNDKIMADIAKDIQECGALRRLATLSQTDSAEAGELLSQLTRQMVNAKASELAAKLNGELPRTRTRTRTEDYINPVKKIIAGLAKRYAPTTNIFHIKTGLPHTQK